MRPVSILIEVVVSTTIVQHTYKQLINNLKFSKYELTKVWLPAALIIVLGIFRIPFVLVVGPPYRPPFATVGLLAFARRVLPRLV